MNDKIIKLSKEIRIQVLELGEPALGRLRYHKLGLIMNALSGMEEEDLDRLFHIKVLDPYSPEAEEAMANPDPEPIRHLYHRLLLGEKEPIRHLYHRLLSEEKVRIEAEIHIPPGTPVTQES
jgi:hypothetical protein